MALLTLVFAFPFLLIIAHAFCPRAYGVEVNDVPHPRIPPARMLDEPRIGDGKETVGEFLFRNGVGAHPGLVIDPEPTGKVIKKILVAPLDVIHPEDAWPQFLNTFHKTTLPEVVERELLFSQGDTWTQEKIDETRRNLRTNVFVNAVEIFPCKGANQDELVVLVVVKDFWSLRTAMNYQFVGSQLVHLELTAGEFNFAGRKQKLALNFGLDISTYLWGQEFEDPRAFGSRVAVRERADVIINKSTGAHEGHVISVGLEKPLYSLDTQWGWSATFDSRRDIYRLMSELQPVQYTSPITGESMPFSYRRQTSDARLSVTRSTGRAVKHDFSAGWMGTFRRFGDSASASAYQQATLDDFAARYMPRSEEAGALFFSYRLYASSFQQLTNIERYGVIEDIRVGPNLNLEQRFASPVFGFSSTYLETVAEAGWTFEGNDNYLTLGVSGTARFQPELSLSSPWVNRVASFRIRNVSPRIGPFRLIASARLTRRDLDLNRSIDVLGGNSALRGYPINYLFGTQSWGANAELRSKPFVIRSLYFGAAAFVDIGDARDEAAMTTHSSVGLGLRLMSPQFARSVMRLDLAFPLENLNSGASPAYFSAQMSQAFF